MLVSGGKIIAIDGVNTTSATLSGDGVFTPLGVNTNTIATTGYVKTKDDEIKNTLSSVSSTLSSAIDEKQDQLEFGYNSFDKINKINGSALAAGNNVIVSAGDDNVHVQSATEGENTIYSISITANPTDVTVSGEHGLSAKKIPSETQTNFTLGLTQTAYNAVTSVSSKLDTTAFSTVSGKFLTAVPGSALWENASKEVTSHSANWNNSYNTLTANSADWLKEDDIIGLATKVELNTASSTLTGQTNYLSGKIDGITADVDYLSGQIDNKLDKSIYVNASSKWETASDKVEASSNYWNNVYDTVNDNSAKWDSVADSANYWNLTYNEFTANSGIWDETTQKVNDSADTWNTVTAKADKEDLDDLRDEVETVSSFIEDQVDWLDEAIEEVSGDVQKISADVEKKLDKDDFTAWSAQTTAWDVDEYTGIDPIKVDNHEISLTANYLSANALDDLSGKWQKASDYVIDNSAKFEDLYDTVDTNSAVWDTVVDKADQEDLETLSGELETVSSFIEDQFDWLKEAIDEVSGDVSVVSAKVNTKLDTTAFESWSAQTDDWDIKPYIAGDNVTIDPDHTINSKDWTAEIEEASANAVTTVEHKFEFDEYNKITAYNGSAIVDTDTTYQAGYGLDLDETTNTFSAIEGFFALSGDVYNQGEIDEKLDELKEDLEKELAKFGFYVCDTATEVKSNGEPDEEVLTQEGKLSTQKIYLVLDSTAPTPDQYKEWIWTGEVWKCIGDTSMSLSEYLTKAKAEELYQKKLTAGNHIDITNDTISVSGLHNTTLTSTNGSIGITATTAANGDVEYDLGVRTIPSISGINGVSAYYDETDDQYVVGLDDYNDIGFAKYSSSANVYTASAVVDGYTEDLNVNPTKITLDNDQILLKTGFYHVDVQTNFTIANPDNNYYNVFVKSIPNAASITQMIDGSYAHTETVDLSFDVRITNDDTPLEISVENFKTNETFAISNLNIHEIVSMPSQIEGGDGNYQAGPGISIDNDTIEAKLGNGLEIDGSNAIQVKLGEGLAFTDDQGIKAISIDPAGDVAEVVKSVEALQDELDTKITDNFPPAMITLADLQVATGTQYAPSNGGMLIGYLFTCPITHNIYVNNEKYQTKIGIYTKQWSGDNKKVILGIYEYDPDYNEGGQVGKTEALCDTGIIELQQGYAEYEIKNVGEKTTPIMTPGKFYYATIYLSYLAGDTNGITLFGAPGYNTQVNNLKPGITITNVNCIRASLYDNMTGYDPNLNFDKMGFSWEYNSYPPTSTTDPTTSQGIVEAHAAGRPYFAIRNVKK